MDKEFLFREIVDMTKWLSDSILIHQLHDFLLSEEPMQTEFQLGGKFGAGFKLRKKDDLFYFDQYIEDETEESREWIKKKNKYLSRLQEVLAKESAEDQMRNENSVEALNWVVDQFEKVLAGQKAGSVVESLSFAKSIIEKNNKKVSNG